MNIRVTLASLLVATSAFASAQIDIGTLDSSDGASTWSNPFNPLFINLAEASTGTWDGISPVPGKGIYDPSKWVVVYKFSSINWGGNYGVVLQPHPSGAPAVFLCQGDVTITSNVSVPPQVGGFPGGLPSSNGTLGSAGLGPGGGARSSGGQLAGPGSYSTRATGNVGWNDGGAVYGNPAILPLVGGSGAGSPAGAEGGHGGGAILIASRTTMSIPSGGIFATGGYRNFVNDAGGSGGAIKLIANTFNSSAGVNLSATGQYLGGAGRIRIEANTFGPVPNSNPSASIATAGSVAKIFATNLTPKSTITKVSGINTPVDPRGNFNAIPDVNLTTAGTQSVEVTCENIPVDGSWSVFVRGVPRNGEATTYTATYAAGNLAWSTWTVNVPFTEGNQVLQVRAKKN
jgi:hypothetical protein